MYQMVGCIIPSKGLKITMNSITYTKVQPEILVDRFQVVLVNLIKSVLITNYHSNNKQIKGE